jgi:hypothetical protein
MILHVAMFTWNAAVTPEEVEHLTAELTDMARSIPEIRRYDCGANLRLRPSAADFGVVALVDDEAGLAAYLDSDAHAAIYENRLARMVSQRTAVQLSVDDTAR